MPSHQNTHVKAVRADIQGLRALAVLAVCGDHLFEWPAGGFVGVDIFFVVSGFLITGILVREWSKTGHTSFTGFYRRRARRILPAALVTVGVTVAVSFALFPTSKAQSVLWDGIAATLFGANIRFSATGTDYFAQGTPSPLQHFWSLSVEEQFYFVWPWLMLAVLYVGTRVAKSSSATATRIAGAIMIGGVIASFVWALSESEHHATIAYFSTFTRAWELGIGAALAIFGFVFARLPMPARIMMAWAGIAIMVGSMFVIDSSSTFPAPWALLPVAGAAMALASGVGTEARGNVLLTNPVSRYIGDISYSLYLWHWPVIILGLSMFPEAGVPYYLGASIVGIILAVASYELIEKPLNGSPLFSRHRSRAERSHAWYLWREHHGQRVRIVFLTVCMPACIGVVALIMVFPPGEVSAEEIAADQELQDALAAQASGDENAYQPTDEINQGVYEATLAGSWPATLTPSIDTAESEGQPQEASLPCALTTERNDECSFGDPADPGILVYGDSLGITLLPTVRAAYGGDHYIRGLTKSACAVTALDVDWRGETKQEEDCMRHRDAVIAITATMRPDIVFVIQNYAWAERLSSGATGKEAATEWTAASTTLYDELIAAGAGQVVLVSPPPEGKKITECATTGASPAACMSAPPGSWQWVHDAETTTGLPYLDETDWFCANGRCPIFNGDILIRRDWVHPTPQYAELIAAAWRQRADRVIALAQ
ncbi:acyltransferase family protein [Microbacterium sp. E-13]|uniref:acyltransferase family protein n=1 Tax=Microbacterium sp. E-13 TaxID=3404048 RepID=UPI003CE91CDF